MSEIQIEPAKIKSFTPPFLKSNCYNFFFVFVIALFFTIIKPSTCEAQETVEQYEKRMAPWREARFGMFIHWGPVTLKGEEIGWSRIREIPIEVYDNLYKQFNPVKFNADEWASIAKASGMKYVVLTTKHHDGFCLWDTKQTDYNIMNTPFKRDVTKELAEACRKQGLAFGVYYSTCDWHHPDFPNNSPGGSVKREKSNLDKYTEYLKAQTGELTKNYGPLFTIWFDVPQEFTKERGQSVIDYLHTLQPNLVINNRTGAAGDYDTPEQTIGGFNITRPWETCMTLCNQWAWRPNDTMKSLKECVKTLLYTIGGDGNLLFNIGPQPDGEVEPRQVERLKEMGDWVKKYGTSIYGTHGGPYKPGSWGVSTRKGNIITLFVMKWPKNEPLLLPSLDKRKVINTLILSGGKAKAESIDGSLQITSPEEKDRGSIATVIELTLDGDAMDIAPMEVIFNQSLTNGKPAKASNFYQADETYNAQKAFDGNFETRWATDENVKEAWLEVDLGKPTKVSSAILDEGTWNRVQKFSLQVKDGDKWQTISEGSTIGAEKEIIFPASITGQIFRLNILEASNGPTILEFHLFK